MLPTNLILVLVRLARAGWLAGAVVLVLACGADAQRTATSVTRSQVGQTRALPECEWCGAPEAPSRLGAEMRLASAGEPGIPLVVSGTVYRPDGRTPAPGVLLYAYHTNASGVYPKRGNETGNGRRHGYLRGWLRTDSHGRYRIITIRPAPYPTRNSPAHIHLTVTPPGCTEDWVDSIMFDDDPLLTPAQRARLTGRGGSGVVHAVPDGRGGLQVTRDIVLQSGRCLMSPNDTLLADVAASGVRWKGTKFAGRGKHEGLVRLASGTLVVRDCSVISGAFTVDLHTIEVTDIPPDDSVPRRRIREHLMSADFFDVARYPVATFAVTGAERVGTRRFRLLGTLAMHGVTRPVAFPIELASYAAGELRAAGRVRLDRQRWGMTYRSFPLANLLVDDEIALDITLVARQASRERLGDSPICE